MIQITHIEFCEHPRSQDLSIMYEVLVRKVELGCLSCNPGSTTTLFYTE